MKKLLVIPALAAFGLLASCSAMSDSGASGMGDSARIGLSSPGYDVHHSSVYQNELRSENSD